MTVHHRRPQVTMRQQLQMAGPVAFPVVVGGSTVNRKLKKESKFSLGGHDLELTQDAGDGVSTAREGLAVART